MKISLNHNKKEYDKKFGKIKYSLLKYTEEQVESFNKGIGTVKGQNNKVFTKIDILDKHNWWKIDDTYYEVPRVLSFKWFKSLHTCVKATTFVLLGCGIAAAVLVPGHFHYIKYFCTYNIVTHGDVTQGIIYDCRKTFEGNLDITVKAKNNYDTELKGIDKVRIGNHTLIENVEYSVTPIVQTSESNDSNEIVKNNYDVLIFKSTLDSYKGDITIKPNAIDVIHVTSLGPKWETTYFPHVGSSESLYVTISPENATHQEVKFVSANPEIISVNDKGDCAVLALGKTTVTAYSVDNPEATKVFNFVVKE